MSQVVVWPALPLHGNGNKGSSTVDQLLLLPLQPLTPGHLLRCGEAEVVVLLQSRGCGDVLDLSRVGEEGCVGSGHLFHLLLLQGQPLLLEESRCLLLTVPSHKGGGVIGHRVVEPEQGTRGSHRELGGVGGDSDLCGRRCGFSLGHDWWSCWGSDLWGRKWEGSINSPKLSSTNTLSN